MSVPCLGTRLAEYLEMKLGVKILCANVRIFLILLLLSSGGSISRRPALRVAARLGLPPDAAARFTHLTMAGH